VAGEKTAGVDRPIDERAYIVFPTLASGGGWTPGALLDMSHVHGPRVVNEIESLRPTERRRLFSSR